MVSKHSPVDVRLPSGYDAADESQIGSSLVTLDELAEDMSGVWPQSGGSNPIVTLPTISSAAPSLTGMSSLISWSSSRFNKQSENWVAVPSSNGPANNSEACQNVTTPRGIYGSSGIGFPCHSVFSFVADTAKIIVVYRVNPTAMVGVTTPHHEVMAFAEHEGEMKSLRGGASGVGPVPALWPHASGGGNQVFTCTFAVTEAREMEWEVWLSSNCWLMGVYVDSGADVQRAPNRPLLISSHGDSWQEGDGNVFAAFFGNGGEAGVGFLNCSLLLSNTALQYRMRTRFAIALAGQGGTGPFANNGGIGIDDTGTGFSPFGSQSQVNFMWTTFGARNPMASIRGGYNDNTLPGVPYYDNMRARYDKILRKFLAKNPEMPIMTEGIQVKGIAPGDARDLSNNGMRDAVDALRADYPRVMPYVNNIADRNYVDIAANNFGPDGIHPRIKGAQHAGGNLAKRTANFTVPRSWVEATMAWAG